MAGRLEMIEREPEHQQAFSCYQDTICGLRSMTAVELHAIPKLVDAFGLAAFREIVTAAGNKAELGSPIRYVEVALEKRAKRELVDAQDEVNRMARERKREEVVRVSDERAREIYEEAAASGNRFAAEILEERVE